MNPLTAVGFLLCSFSLLRLQTRPRPFAAWSPADLPAQAAAGAAAVIGLVRLSEVFFSWHIGLDRILFRSALESAPGDWPNRMAPNTALCFLLLAVAILTMDAQTRGGRRPAQYLALFAGVIGTLALVGYAYGVDSFYGLPLFIPMAFTTSAGVLLLSFAVLSARPDVGLMAIFVSDTSGGALVRRLLPVAFLLPILLGWLRWEGESAGLYETSTGIALYTTSMIVVLGLAVWMTAHWLERAEHQRRLAQQELDNIFSLSLDLLCIAGFDGYFKRLNPAWQTVLGYPLEELLARPYLDFVHPDDREATLAEARKIAAGATTLSFENRYRARDATYHWFLWVATPDLNQGLIYAAARDITDRKRDEETLRGLNRELEAFTYSVSHDLRAPLRHIDGFSRVLLEDYGPALEPEARRCLHRVREGTRKMGQLIDDLLDLSRVSRSELRRQPLPLQSLLDRVRDELRAELNGREVEWRVGELGEVEADPALLQLAFANLLSNALKYSRARRPAVIEIGRAHRSPEPVFFVRDNGVGFDMKYAHKLFGVFQRLHRSEEFEGTGVGLAIVQRVVSKHGGRVWAEAEPGRGATFFLLLPAPQSVAGVLDRAWAGPERRSQPRGGGQP